MALDLSLSYPNELTSVGAYDDMVDAGARPPIVSKTCGRSLQFVNYENRSGLILLGGIITDTYNIL